MNVSERVHLVSNAPNIYDRAEKSKDAVATAVLAVASVEAFIHDLVNWLNFLDEHEKEFHPDSSNLSLVKHPGYSTYVYCFSELGCRLTEVESRILTTITDIEKNRGSVELKVKSIFRVISPSDALLMEKNLKEFSFLVAVRNEIVHPKGERLIQKLKNGKTSGNISGKSKVVRRLESDGLIDKMRLDQSWLNALSDNFIRWCLIVVSNLIEDVLENLPKTKIMMRFCINSKIGRYCSSS